MAEKTLNAASNPDLANKLVADALQGNETAVDKAELTAPFNGVVDLPVGYLSPSGEVIRTAEVRELTGKDEEHIVRQGTIGKALLSIVDKATVKIGDAPATQEILNSLLIGDRDSLALGIYRATFGDTAVLPGYCDVCRDAKEVEVDIRTDIKTKMLVDPKSEIRFEFQGKKGLYEVALPTGHAQRALLSATDKSAPELQTILLEQCLLSINGNPVLSPLQVQNLNLKDRKDLIAEINKRNPGPQLETVVVDCFDCEEGKVRVPMSIGAIFQL
jgi:hypothetical protein